ncbi:hypothetical protein EJ06DRAFT_458006, partial [Trichodelitschia bisporula]
PTKKPNNVLIMRNFPRLSNPVMNDILSHKHASLFSNPVRERDAEGYRDMIRRPQDLKSIKAAINAGARAALQILNDAAAEQAGPEGAPGRVERYEALIRSGAGFGVGGPMLSMPATPELVPPLGIVNSAQMERELMRMFANAVMFNPGEEDVVRDAREMFESVSVAMGSVRSVER